MSPPFGPADVLRRPERVMILAWRRGLLPWVVLLSLVAAQALGLMHQVVHAPSAGGMPAAAAAATAAPATAPADRAAAHGHAESWIEALFAGHGDDSTCRLFDPLQPEASWAVTALALPLVLASGFSGLPAAPCFSRRVAPYQARGPPFPR